MPAVLLSLGLGLTACSPGAPPDDSPATAPGVSGVRYLAAGNAADDGFARASAARAFAFPADHGSHPGYRTEWWYFTGNVFDTAGNHYGFELTLFRLAASAVMPSRESPLATNQVWMGNLAVTDTRRQAFKAAERLSRGAAGLAGVSAPATSDDRSIVIALEDWSIRFVDRSVTLVAADAEIGIELELEGLERIVLQGDAGLDRKGPEPGNASYYYSAPRLAVTGRLRSAGEPAVAVTGSAWMDREWSTSALSSGIAGWDWFALQLDDGTDLMFYRLRADDGSTSRFSGGTLTAPTGSTARLDANDVVLGIDRHWRSARSGARYPVAWTLSIPAEGIELQIRPQLDDQEIDLSVRYWEGAVSSSGRRGARALSGLGYLELVGY